MRKENIGIMNWYISMVFVGGATTRMVKMDHH